jgi:hypothetical protein
MVGPHKILHLKGDCNIEIQLKHNNRKTVVHANRLKPNFVVLKNLAVCPDFIQVQQPSHQPATQFDAPPVTQTNDTVTNFYDNVPRCQIFLIYNTRKWLNCKIHRWL